MSKLAIYSKNTCVTCKKAKVFLEEQGVGFEEKAIEKEPPAEDLLRKLIAQNGLKNSLNSRSALYKEKNMGKQLPDEATALKLMQQDPNLIKRPVIVKANGELYQGFDPDSLKHFLGS